MTPRFNPWWGCDRVSPACAHCYADTFANRLGMDLWDDKRRDGSLAPHEFRFFGDKHWDEPLKWARTLPAKLGRRPRVFCASMADVFEERDELAGPRERLWNLIDETPELDWLVLTKRPEFARDWLCKWYGHHLESELHEPPNENVWLGVSIENARFTWRADVLREIPAAVRFVSAEPLLGSLYAPFNAPMPNPRDPTLPGYTTRRAPLDLRGIDWVIIGGESGGKSRPFHLEHAREIIARCDPYAPVCCGNQDGGECCGEPIPVGAVEDLPAVFVKQLGAKPVQTWCGDPEHRHAGSCDSWSAERPLRLHDRKGGDINEWPADLRIREFPRSAVPA